MNYNQKLTNANDRTEILLYLKSKKEANPNFTLLDIGASANPWTIKYVTHAVDITRTSLNAHQFIGNANDIHVWQEVLDYVKIHGKFDFCSCTHFLEDITAAKMVMTMINKIANEGFVAVPSKYAELNMQNEGKWLGWVHHSWIYDYKDEKFIGYKKQAFVENFADFREWGQRNPDKNRSELQFQWKGELVHEMAMGELLGPTSAIVVRHYADNLLK